MRHQFHQFHHGGGVKEMQTQHVLGLRQTRCDTCDRQGRCVRGDHGIGAQMGYCVTQNGDLDIQPLDHRLDHHIRWPKASEGIDYDQTIQNPRHRIFA